MIYRQLGRTGLDVSAIGIGTEHMYGQPRETVVSTIRAAIEHGINYFDVIFSMPEYLDNLRAAYGALPVKASACSECDVCTRRCPFGVDVVPRLQQAVMVFEG